MDMDVNRISEMKEALSIKKAGLKVTETRVKILAMLGRDGGSHMSAEDISHKFFAEGGKISLATIYRALTHFEEANLVIRHQFTTGLSVYELCGSHHDHMICNECGRIVEFVNETIEACQKQVAEQNNFKLTGHHLTLRVDCMRKHCHGRRAP